MRILFLDQFTDWGGAQIVLRDTMAEAQAQGWEPLLMAPGDGPLRHFCESTGILFEQLEMSLYGNGQKSTADVVRFGFDSARATGQIRETIRRERVDLVFVNGPRVLLAAARASECPMIFHAHSRPDQRYARALMRWCIKYRGVAVIAVSKFAASAHRCDASVVYNGVEDTGYVPRPRSRGVPKIGIIGRISPEKGQMDFVRAAKLLEASEARFLVFGASLFSDESYQQAVQRAAGANVEFRGWTDDVPGALHEIDILVVPSSAIEACPRIVLEAFAAGTPMVAYPSGGIPELITHGETGLVTESPTLEALARGIHRMLECPELMERCSRLGRADWEARFSSERFRREMGDAIQRVALRKTGRSAVA